jgi:hypothetical protein
LTWQSWYKLKQRQDVIKEGWERCGLARVLDAAQQMEAMRYWMDAPAEALGVELHVEDTESEGEDVQERVKTINFLPHRVSSLGRLD